MRTYGKLGLLLAVVALAMLARGVAPAYAWSYPAALNSNAATDGADDNAPQVAADGAGNLVAVWDSDDDLGGTIGTDYDILVARSDNNGATWTAAAALTTNSAWDRFPRVATDDGDNWLAVWMSSDNLGGTIGSDVDILVSRSSDNGATWTSPIALDTNAGSDSDLDWDGCQAVASDGGDNWVAVWDSRYYLESTGTDACDMVAARSTDNGATWSDPTTLNITPACDQKGGGACFAPQVAGDGGGNWVAVWHSKENLGGTIGTDYDILTARSTDNAATWMAPTALNTNAATDSGSDGGPEVATDGEGNWMTVWGSDEDVGGIGTDDDILVARSTDNGATWSAPIALNTNAASDSGDDGGPEVATDGAGNWMTVWASNDSLGGTIGTDADILVARSTSEPGWPWTWTDPAVLNTNAASDSGDDDGAQVATAGGGKWVAVWESDENLFDVNLGDFIGTDVDILHTTDAPVVGGIAELPEVSGSSARNYIALAGLAAAALVALGAGGWYARRRLEPLLP
jgi:hypothetical protein